MSSPDPVPSYFGPRYLAWLLWSNAITVLSVLQGVFASVLLVSDPSGHDPDPLIPHNVSRFIILGNAVLTGIIAQLKRNNPPGPPPTRSTERPQ